MEYDGCLAALGIADKKDHPAGREKRTFLLDVLRSAGSNESCLPGGRMIGKNQLSRDTFSAITSLHRKNRVSPSTGVVEKNHFSGRPILANDKILRDAGSVDNTVAVEAQRAKIAGPDRIRAGSRREDDTAHPRERKTGSRNVVDM